MLRFNFVKSADTASNQHAIAITVPRIEINGSLPDRPVRRDQSKLAEAIDAAFVLCIELNVVARFEIANLAAKSNFELSTIKALDETNSALSGTDSLPDIVQIATKRSDDAETCHYNPTT